jgi:peptide/nickel transport system permease protein
MDYETRVGELQVTEERRRRSLFVDVFARLVREKPLGTFGLVIVVLLLLTGIFADLAWLGLPDIGLAPYHYNKTNPAHYLAPPSGEHILGADNLGRDVFSRVIYGARISVTVGLGATAISAVIAGTIGTLSGYIGGRTDIIVQRFVDGWMCFPGLVLLIAAISLVGPGIWQVVVVLGVLFGIGGSRIVRGAVIGIKENVYFEAAEAIGSSTWHIIFRHILPNIMAPMIIVFSTQVPGIIMIEASLSFLGFGIPPPFPSWGGMLSRSGRTYMEQAWWMAVWPGAALAVVVYGINMFGDALRDLLDPRLRGGLGRYSGVKAKMKKKQAKEEAPATEASR